MSELKINIPKPCIENWNKMTPIQNGRHCNTCNQSVVDFSEKSEMEILDYFSNLSSNQNICGRFKKSQINSENMPTWFKIKCQNIPVKILRIASLLLINFLISIFGRSNLWAQGAPRIIQNKDTVYNKDTLHSNQWIGKVLIDKGNPKKKTNKKVNQK